MTNHRREGVLVTIIFLLFLIAFDVLFMTHPRVVMGPATGHVLATVNISGFVYANCSYVFPKDFSLFSAFCFGTEDNVTTVFQNMTSLEYIFSYDPSDSDDPWLSYNPHLPWWAIQDLGTVSRAKGYWIKLGASETFTASGILKYENTLSLGSGWNLIGYPIVTVRSTPTTFASIAGRYSEAAGYNETLQEYQTYRPDLVNNTLNWTYPYHGYWVYMVTPGTLQLNN